MYSWMEEQSPAEKIEIFLEKIMKNTENFVTVF